MKKENLTVEEQIKILKHYISELCKYAEETATILGLDTSATILGRGCIEYWAVLSSASNDAIKKLQQENGELKNELDLYKTWYRAKHDDVKNCLGCYRKALEEIEKYCNYKFCDKFGEFTELINKNSILDIINKAKDGNNEQLSMPRMRND